MTLKLTLFSQEVEDFVLEIKIDADAKFSELHQLIMNDCGYMPTGNHSFLLCDEDWRVRNRIWMEDDGSVGSDEDLYLMEDCTIGEFLEDEGQRLAYVFDPDGKRYFLMELTENLFGQPQKEAVVSRRHGKAPSQLLADEEETTPKPASTDTEAGEEFYGEEGFEDDELDMEGFEIDEQG